MDAVWGSAVAVVGTLLGAVVTYAFQRDASRRSERFARAEALRRERVGAYSEFAGVLEDYRRGQAERWYRGVGDPGGEGFLRARDEGHRLRTQARQALYRVRLLTDDDGVSRAAEQAYRCTWEVSNAEDQPGHDARDAEARQAIEAFVAHASQVVR